MRRWKWHDWILALAVLALLAWIFRVADSEPPRPDSPVAISQPPSRPPAPTAADSLLTDYADPATPPIEDLKKIHRVVTGYFSVVKDSARFPIGGNADLSAALRGENPNREIYVRPDHPVFSAEGLLADRWGSPLVVHPEAWKQLELRSAGPDKVPFTEDDLVLTSAGIQPRPEK